MVFVTSLFNIPRGNEFNSYTDSIHILAVMVNSSVNPLVYGAANKEYREYLVG